MNDPDPLAPPGPDAVAVGTGRLTLDVIVAPPAPLRRQAGGTCGNVLANLAYLGWRSHPVTALGDDPAGRQFTHDLARWGASLDLIATSAGRPSPVIVHHIRPGADGQPVHSFSSRCPFCGGRLPEYEPLPAEVVRRLLPRLPPARVCFFDRPSEGALLLARACAARGALVVFEPNYADDSAPFAEALASAHIVKFSRARLPDFAEARPLSEPRLVVETLGGDGLRYRGRGLDWRHLPAVPISPVRDTAGCGDWCTAGFLHALGPGGARGLEEASTDRVEAALRFGQVLAAWNCPFEGARGSAFACDRPSFARGVRQLLAGEVPSPPRPPILDADPPGSFCPHCGGGP